MSPKKADSLQQVCKAYGMEVNVKKIKVMVFGKEGNGKCEMKVNEAILNKLHHTDTWVVWLQRMAYQGWR